MSFHSGYTAVTCAACTGPGTVGPALQDALRPVVRASTGGVLVGAGCLAGCAGRPAGPVLLVQPCDGERRPTSPALRIGPLRTGADVDAVTAWLGAGDLDPALLPRHLVVPPRRRTTTG
jgi:hypothetical protein